MTEEDKNLLCQYLTKKQLKFSKNFATELSDSKENLELERKIIEESIDIIENLFFLKSKKNIIILIDCMDRNKKCRLIR